MGARSLAHLALAFLLACSAASTPPVSSPSASPSPTATGPRKVIVMNLTSPSIKAGRPIPSHNSCRTDDYSPVLRWNSGPKGTKTYAIIFDDPDTTPRAFVMWMVWDIRLSIRALQENRVPPGSHLGRNDNGIVGYSGPCFPERSRHRYRFTVYALSASPNLPQGTRAAQFRRAIGPLIVGVGTLVAKGY